MVSEDQLLDRDEAIKGKNAEYLQELDERGDTVINPDQLPEEEEEVHTRLTPSKRLLPRCPLGSPE